MAAQVCSICLNEFTNPKIIDCNHVFCENCLADFINKSVVDSKFACPTCRSTITVPVGGASSYPTFSEATITVPVGGASSYPTFSEEELKPTDKEELKPTDEEESKDDQVKCVVCENGVNAEFECIECDKLMCNSCKTPHDVFFKLHHVDILQSSKKESKTLCLQHEGEELEYFCTDCNEPVCEICLHQEHKDHSTPDIEEYRGIAKTDLSQIQKEFNNYVDDMKVKISTARQNIVQFRTTIDEKINKMKQMGDELKDDFEMLCNREEAKMTNDKHLLTRLETASRCISKAVDDDSSIDVLHVLPKLKLQLWEMKTYEPHFDINNFNKVFTEELSDVLHARSFKYTFHCKYTNSEYCSPKFIVSGIYWEIKLQTNDNYQYIILTYLNASEARNTSVEAEFTFKLTNIYQSHCLMNSFSKKFDSNKNKEIRCEFTNNFSPEISIEVLISYNEMK